MNSLIPMLLIALAGSASETTAPPPPAEGPPDEPRSMPLNLSIGFTSTFSALGVYGEAIVDHVWALQIQHYDYHEFVGFFKNTPSPLNRFTLTAIHLGAYAKFPHVKAGVLTGVGTLDGVVRGRILSGRETGCPEECGYVPLEGKRLVVPLKFVLGLNASKVGMTLAPQLYFHDGPVFWNALISMEIGIL